MKSCIVTGESSLALPSHMICHLPGAEWHEHVSDSFSTFDVVTFSLTAVASGHIEYAASNISLCMFGFELAIFQSP